MLVASGRRFVEIAATFIVAVALATFAFYMIRIGGSRLPQQIVRLALTIGLAVGLLRGWGWARWLTIALCALAFALVIVALGREGFRTMAPFPSLVLLGIALGYGVVARGLLYSASVRAFFASARER
jgi:hypothetical protein